MANKKLDDSSQKTLEEIAKLERDLQTSKQKFQRDILDMHGVLSDTTKNALQNYTQIARTVKDTMGETAKLALTMEESIKLQNRIVELREQENTIEAKIKALNESVVKIQGEGYKIAKDELENSKKSLAYETALYEAQQDKLNELNTEFAKIAKSRTTANNALRKQIDLERTAVNALASEAIKRVKITNDQVKAQQDALDNITLEEDTERMILQHQMQSLKLVRQQAEAQVANVKSLTKSRAIWVEMAKRVFPQTSAFASGMSKDFKAFGVGGGLALGAVTGIALAVKLIAESMFRSDQEATDLARNMTITKAESRVILKQFEAISNTMSGVLFSSRDILKSQMEMNEALGTTMFLRADDLKTITKSRELLGLSTQSIKEMAEYAFAMGKSMESIKNDIFGTSKSVQIQNGLFLQDRQILESVLKISGGMRANFKGSVKEMAAAVTKAKSLGIELSQIQKSSENLLNFESSISSELEAELLTGKQLNLERARSAALVGDMSTVMSEMVKQAGTFDQYSNMNVISQTKLAEAFGLSRDEFSDMLFKQSALNRMRSLGLSGDQKDLIKNFDELKRSGKDVAAILGENVANKLEIQSAQEKFAKVMEKIQVIFDRLFESGIIDSLITKLANVAQYFSEGGSVFGGLFGGGFTPDNPYTKESLGLSSSDKNSANGGQSSAANSGATSKTNSKLPQMYQPITIYLDTTKVGSAMGMSKTPTA